MTRKIRHRAAARADLLSIGSYSDRQWGRMRTRAYLRELHQTIAELARNPMLGAEAGLWPEGVRKKRAGRHLILYLANDRDLEVVRILHERMDPSLHLR
jgi:toxin ParE1/3/4